MLDFFFAPILEFLGIGLIPFLLLILILVLIFRG